MNVLQNPDGVGLKRPFPPRGQQLLLPLGGTVSWGLQKTPFANQILLYSLANMLQNCVHCTQTHLCCTPTPLQVQDTCCFHWTTLLYQTSCSLEPGHSSCRWARGVGLVVAVIIKGWLDAGC